MENDESRNAEVALSLEKRIEEYQKRLHEKRSADVKRGMAIRAERGHHVSRIPIGYRRQWRDGEFHIEADPIQAPLVYQAFMLATTGEYSIRKLHSLMREMGLRHSDGRVPSVSGLYRLLVNPFYLGVVESGGRSFAGKHPALTSPGNFRIASELFASRSAGAERKRGGLPLPGESV